MKKGVLILILFLISLGIILFLSFNLVKQNLTGAIISNYYSYTKAICNETNYCQDYEIVCRENEIVKIAPIAGATIQHNLDWKDPRDKKTINNFCE